MQQLESTGCGIENEQIAIAKTKNNRSSNNLQIWKPYTDGGTVILKIKRIVQE